MKKALSRKSKDVVVAKPGGLRALVAELRSLIQSARQAAANTIDVIQVVTNFEIGRRIVQHEQKGHSRAAYGTELLKHLSVTLTREFGRGFSRANLEYMRRFFLLWRDRAPQISQSVIGKLPKIVERATGKDPRKISQLPIGKSSVPFILSWTHYLLLMSIKDELWNAGSVLTDETLQAFTRTIKELNRTTFDAERTIEEAVGRSQPSNVNVASRTRSAERLFLESLRQQVYEGYGPAFAEVTEVLEAYGLRREELQGVGPANETNRFLSWIRLTHVVGDEAWQLAVPKSRDERRNEIVRLGDEWRTTNNPRIAQNYVASLQTVLDVFGTREALISVTREQLTAGLMALHAFSEQLRFVKGGSANLPTEFWNANGNDMDRVKRTLDYLLQGSGDFIERLYDVIYDARVKLKYFGKFCALELYGTVNPAKCPPLNGRMAKTLRYLGFAVSGS